MRLAKVSIIIMLILVLLSGCKQQTSGEAVAQSEGDSKEPSAAVAPVEVEIPEGSGPVCYDTDNANNPYTSGYVYGVKADGERFTVKDSCYHGMLLEYYCEGTEYRNQNYRCVCTTEGRICPQ